MSNNSQSTPQRLGKYELREHLGRGGMAEVWKAFDTELERYVAIKLLHADLQTDPEFITRFTREARAIASLHHPNIIQIHDFQIFRSSELGSPTAYMVMDYVEGQTLARYIHSTSHIGKFPPPTDIIQIFMSISQAIDYAHQHGMIHRDIKPANILLDQRNTKHVPMGEPILTDFGIAKILGAASGTISGMWLGTPLYTSPEQAQGHPGSERSDIYSLGVILYEMCAGVPPFRGENVTSIILQHANAMPLPPALINPNIPPALSMVILRCLAKDPTMRFSSASSVAAALAEAFHTDEMNADEIYRPTYISPFSVQPTQSAFQTNPEVSAPPIGSQAGRITPIPTTPEDSLFANSQNPQATTPSQAPSSPSPPRLWRRRRGLLVTLIAMTIIVLLSSGLGAFYWLTHTRNVPFALSNQIVGHAFFISSGQTGETSNQGITDELQIHLSNVSSPASGKSYYGWLEPDVNKTLGMPVLLGYLPVNNGTIQYLYKDPRHANLLATTSRFLITEEDSAVKPNIPSPDVSTWRYSAQFPQPTGSMNSTPTSIDMASMENLGVLDHMRHLLSQAPELQAIGLPGGLDIWLFRNSEKVLEWSVSARDDWQVGDFPLLHRHIVRILDYLDGLSFVQHDAPGEPVLVNKVNAEIGLLDVDPMARVRGFLYTIDFHLNAVIQSTGSTPDQRKLAIQIDNAIKNVEFWLASVRKDAQQLEQMSQAQLALPATRNNLLDTMANDALSAFAGHIDPDSGNVQEGVIQIHYNIQRLATFDIAPY
jgi:eukaryotic-like serine/threonine-protein kinase